MHRLRGHRSAAGHDWAARTNEIRRLMPDVDKWYDRDMRTAALHDNSFTVTRG
ncbi:hypothetical protein ACWD7C_34575 [Streptomyces sp. NPDC005134]|uniref:hypothetical protein n=1 Tax=unclassified Streptomyces TaxID=2593676 RepID=UPI0033BEBDC1